MYEDYFWGAMICNTQYMGGGLLMARDSQIDDGVFEFFSYKEYFSNQVNLPLYPAGLKNTFITKFSLFFQIYPSRNHS